MRLPVRSCSSVLDLCYIGTISLSLHFCLCDERAKLLFLCVLFNGAPSSSLAKQGSTEHGNLSRKMSSGISSQWGGGSFFFFLSHDPIF